MPDGVKQGKGEVCVCVCVRGGGYNNIDRSCHYLPRMYAHSERMRFIF
jgi:hypothetical protein